LPRRLLLPNVRLRLRHSRPLITRHNISPAELMGKNRRLLELGMTVVMRRRKRKRKKKMMTMVIRMLRLCHLGCVVRHLEILRILHLLDLLCMVSLRPKARAKALLI
jgi:hypothetical protein